MAAGFSWGIPMAAANSGVPDLARIGPGPGGERLEEIGGKEYTKRY